MIGRNGGENTLAHWPTASGMMTVDEASCSVLRYLDRVSGSLSSSGNSILHLLIPSPNFLFMNKYGKIQKKKWER